MVRRSAQPLATSKSRTHLRTRSFVSPLELFFKRGPAFVLPTLDGGFVSLAGPLHRLLHAVLQSLQQPTTMAGMIAHAILTLDHLSHPLRSPHLAAKPKGLRS